MLKQLFNNPWFVYSLGIVAVVYLAWSVATPLFGGEEFADVEDVIVDPFEQADSDLSRDQSHLVAALGREQIEWLHSVERDPFEGTLLHNEAAGTAAPPRTYALEALFVSSEVRAAVINNKLVRVGDSVDQFQVTHIAPDYVELTNKQEILRLEPEV